MKQTIWVVWLACLGLLGACSEGGIGGTGAGVTVNPGNVTVSGQGNKGPFVADSSITVESISGTVGEATTTVGLLGQYDLRAPLGSVQRVTITGHYFNELTGLNSPAPLALSAVLQVEASSKANINVATHLTRARIESLISGGLDASVAIDQTTDELLLALSPVIPAPANAINFNNLVLINASQVANNNEGNAWLLALSVLVEAAAQAAGNDANVILSALANDFSDDGTVGNETLALLQAGVPLLDPDAIHGRLVNLDAQLRAGVLTSLASVPGAEATNLPCRVYQSEVICLNFTTSPITLSDAVATFDTTTSSSAARLDIEVLIANLNRFIDTDGDGEVNALDDDDDNDGTLDSEDSSPYGV